MNRVAKLIRFLAVKLLNIRPIKVWLDAHPGTRELLAKRLSFGKFTGFPLTILSVSFLFALVLLIGLIQDYLAGDPITLLDSRIENLIFVFRSDALLRFFYFITLFAESTAIIVLSVIATVIFWLNRQRIYACTLWLSLAVGEGLTFLGKNILHRERPDAFLRAISEDSFSFPSGHATSVVVLYGFLAYIVIRNFVSWRIRATAVSLLVGLVLFVDLSRMYLGVHYLSDVIAGNLVGLAALLVAISITEWFLQERNHTQNKVKWLEVFSIPITAVILVSIFYHFASPPVTNSRPESPRFVTTQEVPNLFNSNQLPKFTETIIGTEQEPINLIIIASSICFIKDIASAGWALADDVSFHTTEQLAKNALLNRAYPTAPMTPSFYNAQPNDFGFEKQTEQNSARSRHHARFWRTDYETPLGTLYVGTVSLDTGIKWGITHAISPDIDTERDLFTADLQQAGVVAENRLLSFVQPHIGANFSGDLFFTNGQSSTMIFRPCVTK